MATLKRRGGIVDNVIDMPVNEGQLPARVADKLRSLQQQIEQLQLTQRQYVQGALDAIGVTGQVNIDFNTMSYTVEDEHPDDRD